VAWSPADPVSLGITSWYGTELTIHGSRGYGLFPASRSRTGPILTVMLINCCSRPGIFPLY